MPQTVRK